jgi:hypothetical protein
MAKPLYYQRQADISLSEILRQHPGGKWRVDWLLADQSKRAAAVYELRSKSPTSDVWLESVELPHLLKLSRRLFSVWLLGKIKLGAVITKQT